MSADPLELTAEEEAYFDNRGATDLPDEAPVEQAVEDEPEGESAEVVESPQANLVPLKVLMDERRERQALAAQIQEREQQFNRLQSRLDTLQEVFQPQAPPPPDYDSDPIGSINHKLDETTRAYQQLQQAEWQRQAAASAVREMESLRDYGKAQADAYLAKQPDFYEAYASVWKAKDAELRAMGYSDEREIHQWITEFEVNMIKKAASDGADVADRMYTMAKAMGYPTKQTTSAQAKLDGVAAGQSASKSLGAAGGTAPASKLTLAALDKMSDEEFAKATSDPEVWRRLNRGG